MLKQMTIVLIFVPIVLISASSSFCLEKLSRSEMQKSTAQAGISMAIVDTTLYNYNNAIRLTNPENSESYLELNGLESVTTINCGLSDINSDGSIDFFEIDLFTVNDVESPINGKAFFYTDVNDLDYNMDMTVNSVIVCATDIGSINVADFNVSSFHTYVGAHDSGIDLEIGFATRTELFEFQYNDAPTSPDTGKLAVTGVTFANTFTGDESDPSTWEADGEFIIGDIYTDNPVVMDFVGGSGDNPNAHVSLQIGAIEGSIRVENINFGGNDVGQVIMDGINITKFDMEMPGRGLGQP